MMEAVGDSDEVAGSLGSRVESRAKITCCLLSPSLCLAAKQGLLPALAKAVMSLFHVSCESARLCLAGTQTELRPINTKCSV